MFYFYIMEISNDKIVKIHYEGTLSDGTVFDSSKGKEPLEFIYGVGLIIPGLEKGILGLKKGDKKKIEISNKDAYGPVIKEAMQEVPKEQFPADIKLEVGTKLMAQGPQGAIPVEIKEVKEKTVLVDLNHPLAGKDLVFDVEIVDVSNCSEEDRKRILGPMMEQQKQQQEAMKKVAEEAEHANDCSDSCSSCASCASCSSSSDSLEDSLNEKDSEDKKE